MSADGYCTSPALAPAAIECRVSIAGSAPFDAVPVHIIVTPDGSVFTSVGLGSFLTFDAETPVARARYGSTTRGAREPVTPIRTVAENVSFLRSGLGLTVSEIADWMGVTRPAVYGWLKNVQPQADTVNLLDQARAAAEPVEALKLHRPEHVIRRPLFDQRSALDLLRAGTALNDEQLNALKELDAREEQQRLAYAKGKPVRSLADVAGESTSVMRS